MCKVISLSGENKNFRFSEHSDFCINSQHFSSRNSVPACIILLSKFGFACLGASMTELTNSDDYIEVKEQILTF